MTREEAVEIADGYGWTRIEGSNSYVEWVEARTLIIRIAVNSSGELWMYGRGWIGHHYALCKEELANMLDATLVAAIV